MKKWILIPLFWCCYNLSFSQGHDWWAANVGWDGKAHWSTYIVYAPRHLGPNALPVPSLGDGRIENEHYLKASLQTHISKGDFTLNPFLHLAYALVPNLISFDLFMVPVEYFRMSHEKRTERHTFHYFYGRQVAIGDVYLHTNIQLTRKRWDTRLRLGYKYASSNMVSLARFTDTPGYYFDLNAARTLSEKNGTNLRLTAMLGMYVWQTNSDIRFQNDALLFGMGLNYQRGSWLIGTHIRGYSGYLNNGDRPVVWKTEMSRAFDRFRVEGSYQVGLHDFAYHSLELGVAYFLMQNDE